jgi:hypothetical protein
MQEVPYDRTTITQCLCYGCPVQVKSDCVKTKDDAASAILKTGKLPTAEELPGMYCSTGTATCTDLDFTGKCPCSVCAVFTDNSLSQWKYCQRGSAAMIG